jgi:dTDP-glucose 4,6-dehydratase
MPDRLGHDYRYASDPIKIMSELGWQQEYSFETGITETIDWYRENLSWWKKVKRVGQV